MMQKENIQNIKLGLLILVGTGILFFTLYYLGKNKDLFNNTFTIHTFFTNVNGLKSGNDVRYAGISIGTVQSVEIINGTSVQVVMTIENKVKKFIKKDAIATIGTDGLMGDKIINIVPGDDNKEMVDDDQIIKSLEAISTDDILRKIKGSNDNASIVIQNAASITSRINEGKGNVGLLLNDSLLAQNLYKSAENIRLTTEGTAQITRDLHVLLDNIKKGKGTAGVLIKDSMLGSDLKQVVADFRETSQKSIVIASGLNQLIENINTKEGALHMILKDTSFASDLSATMNNLKDGTAGLNQTIEGLQHTIFLRKYFRKKNKGIKSLETAPKIDSTITSEAF
jgi:phospholipid/cholesterol/gamma-HCH transport system substrate-binding protein